MDGYKCGRGIETKCSVKIFCRIKIFLHPLGGYIRRCYVPLPLLLSYTEAENLFIG